MKPTEKDMEAARAWLSEHLGGWPVGEPDALHIAGKRARLALEEAFAAARLEGVRAGIEAAHHEAATITVALSGEQVGERREMLARIRALDAERIAGGSDGR